jgi:hypothetical protein
MLARLFRPGTRRERTAVDDAVIAGVRAAANELGYEITATSKSPEGAEDTLYGFSFSSDGQGARVELLINAANVARFGLTLSDYARWEVLDALRASKGQET